MSVPLKGELLVNCPRCGRKNYTVRGLKSHWCFGKAQELLAQAPEKVRLTDDEIAQAVRQALNDREGAL
jgi:uncharacterized C2H2 Zn-finger protein